MARKKNKGAASLPQILEKLAESISKLVGPEEPVLSRESTSAPHQFHLGPASNLHILRRFAHSISEIAHPQESGNKSLSNQINQGAASDLQILRKLAESITNIATQEEPKLPPPKQIFPLSFPDDSPLDDSPEEIEEHKRIRQAQLQYQQSVEEDAREREAKQIYPESPVVPRVRRPKPSMSQTAPQTETDIPDQVIIAFVEEMEKAHQHFKFRDYLRAQSVIEIKHNSNPDDILCKFKKFQTREMKEFNFLDLTEICNFIEDYIFELKAEDRILKGLKAQVPAKDAYAHSNPVSYLLSQARQKSYVLDENLRAELKNLKIRTPLFYHDSLISRKPTVEREARTVVVSNISDDASEKDIWNLFYICGAIEDFECHRSITGQISFAYITFKNAPAAQFAIKITDTRLPHKIQSEKLPLLVKFVPKSVEDASRSESVAVDVKSKVAEALNKYRELWTYYSKIESKDGKACKKENEIEEWMQLEALANGGYTFGGQDLFN